MKKNSIVLGILTCLVFGAFAMEEGELSKEEANKLYWESVKNFNNGSISYNEYRNNMMRAIPMLDYVQDHYHDPLKIAVTSNDYDFAQFLLDHGASPRFRGMSGLDSFDMWRNNLGRPKKDPYYRSKQDPEYSSLYNLLENYQNLNPHPRKRKQEQGN